MHKTVSKELDLRQPEAPSVHIDRHYVSFVRQSTEPSVHSFGLVLKRWNIPTEQHNREAKLFWHTVETKMSDYRSAAIPRQVNRLGQILPP